MSNSWQDIANATLIVVWGANPSENHPACMAHINRARFPKDFFTGARANKEPATLVVIDPRKTRTALQADLYVRIRPGTDIAFGNAVMRYIIEKMETPNSKYSDGVTPIPQQIKDNFFSYLNQASNGTFFKDGATTTSAIPAPAASVPDDEGGNCSKYTDARFIVNNDDTDYVRGRLATAGSNAGTWVANADPTTDQTVSDFPKKSRDIYTGNTVFKRLRAHLAPYTLEVAADICGCLAEDIAKVADLFIKHSRHASTPETGTFVRTYKVGAGATPLWAYGVDINGVTEVYNVTTGQDITAQKASVLSISAGPGSPYAMQTVTVNAVAGATSTGDRVRITFTGTTDQAPQAGYRATTMLYAMGLTQHTCGSQNVKMFANLQALMGNMGRAGGGINALRGIHNVQGSTDMGLLYHLIPGYSGNPTAQPNMTPSSDDTTNAFGKYMDALWGNTLNNGNGTGTDTPDYARAYTPSAMGLQQRGFFNMTLKWFGDYDALSAGGASNRRKIDACYSLWPKTNGDNHIQMFRKMADGAITAAVVWGQNPAVTEPNQSKVREGLEKLDLLVVVDMFETETAAAKRKTGGITYLIPAASHVEKAGSATNSGRALQWRYEARRPQGNSKDDIELLLRLAKAFADVDAFSHIADVWDAYGIKTGATSQDVWTDLYKKPYTAKADGTGGFDPASNNYYSADVSGDVERAVMRKLVSDPVTYETVTVQGSEWVAERIYREWASPLGSGGTLWLYTEGYDAANVNTAPGATAAAPRLAGDYTAWGVANRAKSRDNADPYGTMGYHKWGYSWLVNRRVLYNNSEVAGDQNDFFMGPDSCIRLFAPNPGALIGSYGGSTLYPGVFNYSRWYRTHAAPTAHSLNDKPRKTDGSAPPAHAVFSLTGRFPSHTEPYETPRGDLAAAWGFNSTVNTAIWNFGTGEYKASNLPNLVYGGTPVAGLGRTEDPDRSKFPLVLTTIRCVEHFQGGPITRNNWWNVDLEPEPWIEINAADAYYHDSDGNLTTKRIQDGDMVNVVTARSNSTSDEQGRTNGATGFARGFRARISVGSQSNQRTGVGVVAIPWHWGDRGLSTGSRANDLCLDAMDANTTIPEYKVCLCRLEEMP